MGVSGHSVTNQRRSPKESKEETRLLSLSGSACVPTFLGAAPLATVAGFATVDAHRRAVALALTLLTRHGGRLSYCTYHE